MDELIKLLDDFRQGRDITLKIEKVTSGIPRWRICLYEHNVVPSPYAGDRELIHVEDRQKHKCIEAAVSMLKLRIDLEEEVKKNFHSKWR